MSTGYLHETNGDKSAMRLMNILSLVAAIAIALITMLMPEADSGTGITLAIAFLSASIGGKVGQKWLEKPVTP